MAAKPTLTDSVDPDKTEQQKQPEHAALVSDWSCCHPTSTIEA